MDADSHIRKGYLLKCPQKALNPFKQKWQSRYFVLFGNSEHGRVRLEYYDTERAYQLAKSKRVIPLSNCVSIKPVWSKDQNHVVEIVIQDRTIHLAATSKDEEKLWFKDLCKIVFGNADRTSLVQVVEKAPSELDFGYHSLDRSMTDGSLEVSPQILHSVPEVEPVQGGSSDDITSSVNGDNISTSGIHGSAVKIPNNPSVELSSLVSFESGFDDASSMASTITEGSTFPVIVRPTLASQKAGMNGTYLLQITSLNLILVDIPSQATVCEWPIQFLRRYGRGRTKFSFEASEKCRHGKGVYTFNTLEGDTIFHLVDTHARGISTQSQLQRKRSSMSEAFRPIGSRKMHHSEGKLVDKFADISEERGRIAESTNDILVLNPSDSVSQAGTLKRADIVNTPRGMSIGSGISLEIAQNMEDVKVKGSPVLLPPTTREIMESSFEEEEEEDEEVPCVEEDLAQTLKVEDKPIEEAPIETEKENAVSELPPLPPVERSEKKKVRRSNSLKLSVSLKLNNSNKEVRKSNSVKRSSSFRNRFFKSKSTDDKRDNKNGINSEHDLTSSDTTSSLSSGGNNDVIDVDIAKNMKVKDILARAIESDMNRNSEEEFNNDNSSLSCINGNKKRRKVPLRHKSNEMLNGSVTRGNPITRLSSSFAGYDYKGHAVLSRTSSDETEAEETKRLQCRTQSVLKKVELYEDIKRQADERVFSTHTFWRRKNYGKENVQEK